MRKKGAERRAGTHAQPTQHQRQAGGRFQPAGEVNPARTEWTPRQSTKSARPSARCRPPTHVYMRVCSSSARTSTSQVLVVGHICSHMNMCSLSAGTSTGQRPTQVLRHGSFSFCYFVVIRQRLVTVTVHYHSYNIHSLSEK